MNLLETIKKYPKDSAIVAVVIVVSLLAFFGSILSDYAKQSFWWKFWNVAGTVSAIALFIGWLYLVAKDKSSKKK